MYEVEGWISEEHGRYRCRLEVWSRDGYTKTLVCAVWEKDFEVNGETKDEEDWTHLIIMSALRQHAAKTDVPLP